MNAPTPQRGPRRLTRVDHIRLSRLVDAAAEVRHPAPTLIERAEDVLDTAEVIEGREMPADVVTMRSRVSLHRSGGEALTLTLVYPDEIGAADGSISVLSPLGLSLLGARQGETVQWEGPHGEAQRAVLAAVTYQPEAAGDPAR